MSFQSIFERLIREFDADRASVEVCSMLREVGVEDRAVLDRVDEYFRQRITRIRKSFEDVCFEGDESELVPMARQLWLEMRFEWNRYNCQMQYQCVRYGGADPELMAIGAITSQLLGRLQELLSPSDVFWLYKLGADPIAAAQVGAVVNERVMQLTSSAHYASQAVMEELAGAQDFVISRIADPEVTRVLQDATADSVALIADNVTLSVPDLHLALEAAFLKNLESSRLFGVFSRSGGGDNLSIPPLIGAAVREIARRWFSHLFANSLEASIEKRVESGKMAHVNATWGVEKQGGHLVVTLSDDGLGVAGADLQISNYANLGLRANVRHDPGCGSFLTLDFDLQIMGLTAVREYLVFVVSPAGAPVRLAIALSAVETLLDAGTVTVVQSMNAVVLPTGETVAAVDAQKFYFDDEISVARHLYLVLRDERGRRLALKANQVEGIVRGRILTHGLVSGSSVVGFLTDRHGAVTVIAAPHLFDNIELPALMCSV